MLLAKSHYESPRISYIYDCILTSLGYSCLKKLGFFMVADRQLTHRITQIMKTFVEFSQALCFLFKL